MDRHAEALKELEAVADHAPKEASVHFLDGQGLQEAREIDDAMMRFTSLLDLEPKDNTSSTARRDRLEEPDVSEDEPSARKVGWLRSRRLGSAGGGAGRIRAVFARLRPRRSGAVVAGRADGCAGSPGDEYPAAFTLCHTVTRCAAAGKLEARTAAGGRLLTASCDARL